jgi:large subunit ribosomal protein L29
VATKRFKEMKGLSQDELNTRIRESEAQLFETRMKKVTGQLEDTAKLWRLRKDLARMKMLLGFKAAASSSASTLVSAGKAAR